MAITRLFTNAKAIIFPPAWCKDRFVIFAQDDFDSSNIISLVSALITYAVQRSLAIISQKTVYRLRKDIDEKLSRLPLSYFDGLTHGEIMSRATNDVDNVNTTLQQGLPQIVTSVVGISGALVMMVIICPTLTIITIITLPLSFLATFLVTKKSQRFFIAQQKALGELNGHVEEMLTGHGIVKAFCYESKSISRFEVINQKLYDSSWKAQFISGFIFPLMNFINNLGYVAIYVAGGVFVAKQVITIGDVRHFFNTSECSLSRLHKAQQ